MSRGLGELEGDSHQHHCRAPHIPGYPALVPAASSFYASYPGHLDAGPYTAAFEAAVMPSFDGQMVAGPSFGTPWAPSLQPPPLYQPSSGISPLGMSLPPRTTGTPAPSTLSAAFDGIPAASTPSPQLSYAAPPMPASVAMPSPGPTVPLLPPMRSRSAGAEAAPLVSPFSAEQLERHRHSLDQAQFDARVPFVSGFQLSPLTAQPVTYFDYGAGDGANKAARAGGPRPNPRDNFALLASPYTRKPEVDRPYKCPDCTHSFNRGHDLKRHRRIHLTIKPFPCGWCEKQFSRKDALKRHLLVKGCGIGLGQTQEDSEAGISRAPSLQMRDLEPPLSAASSSGFSTAESIGKPPSSGTNSVPDSPAALMFDEDGLPSASPFALGAPVERSNRSAPPSFVSPLDRHTPSPTLVLPGSRSSFDAVPLQHPRPASRTNTANSLREERLAQLEPAAPSFLPGVSRNDSFATTSSGSSASLVNRTAWLSVKPGIDSPLSDGSLAKSPDMFSSIPTYALKYSDVPTVPMPSPGESDGGLWELEEP